MQVITGLMVSSAVIVKLHDLVLALPSSAVIVISSESPSPVSFVANEQQIGLSYQHRNYQLAEARNRKSPIEYSQLESK